MAWIGICIMKHTKIIYLVTKRPDLSWQQFVDHWTGPHASLAQEMPGLRGYSINLASPEQHGERPFDGFAELHFDSRDAAKAAWASPEGRQTALDGENFMLRPPALMVDEFVVIPPPPPDGRP
jgi:uncharacterized protein (TIGR02118 family)